ncbi:exonuclease subunit V gamma recC domain protein [Mycobacterium xenopi 4042]|uniref:Exonuclease subunit V gamma recC domain protein n=1 Tax=Mycobacterium xenopi 4042 TaxID=1299334 RepID=X8BJ13_MYCXE|nr:exonuclease subunit V gamma recC domain protein [Mycobacterium xenopi 4042]
MLPAPPPGDIALADLLEFFKDPVKGFFRRWITRCRGTSTRSRTRCRSRSAPCRSGSSATACCTTCCAHRRPHRGRIRVAARHIAAGQLGWRKAKKIRDRAAKLAEATLRARHGEPRAHDVPSTSAMAGASPARSHRFSATASWR